MTPSSLFIQFRFLLSVRSHLPAFPQNEKSGIIFSVPVKVFSMLNPCVAIRHFLNLYGDCELMPTNLLMYSEGLMKTALFLHMVVGSYCLAHVCQELQSMSLFSHYKNKIINEQLMKKT